MIDKIVKIGKHRLVGANKEKFIKPKTNLEPKCPIFVVALPIRNSLWWIAKHIDLPGISGEAPTRIEATRRLKENARDYIKTCAKSGIKVDINLLDLC